MSSMQCIYFNTYTNQIEQTVFRTPTVTISQPLQVRKSSMVKPGSSLQPVQRTKQNASRDVEVPQDVEVRDPLFIFACN
jgi:hypothetical protein